MRYRYATTTLFTWCLGALIGDSGFTPLPALVSLGLLACLIVWNRRWWILLPIASLLIGIGYARQWRLVAWRSIKVERTEFSGKIVAAPDRRAKIQYLTVQTEQPIAQTSRGQPATVRLLIQADRFAVFHYGDKVAVKGKLTSPEKFDTFDYPLFLERSSIFGIVKQPEVKLVERAPPSWQATFIAARTYLEDTINRFLPEPESSFLAGLLLGSRRAIPSDLTDALQATGTSHLVAISGANITIVVSGALLLLPLTSNWSQFGVITLIAGGLGILTGGSASVLRGALVVILGSFARAYGRRPWPLALILLAAVILLLYNPLLIRADPSFQLSFGAYAGLIACGNWFTKLFTRFRLPEIIRGSLAETTAASTGTFPLTIMAGSFAARGFIVNPLVLWLIPAATALGFALIAASFVPALARLIALPTWFVLHGILRIIQISASFGKSS